MRNFLVAIAIAMLPASSVLAEQPAHQTSAKPVTSGRVLPIKGANVGNSCAAYGAGFVKIEGTETCVKIGGAISIGAGGSSGSR